MDAVLRAELNKVKELQSKVFPTHAPDGKVPPYLVYYKSDYGRVKTFEGIGKQTNVTYFLSILSNSYKELDGITKKVTDQLLLLPQRKFSNIFIEDVTINKITEQYEHELKMDRKIIDISFSYKEE